MSSNHYSDEPRLIKPTRTDRRFLTFLCVIIGSALLLGSVVGSILYRNWQEEQSHLAERGMYDGAVYNVEIDGRNHRLELGWQQDRLVALLGITNPQDTVIYVKGKFGEEILRHNPQPRSANLFGPSQAQMDPFKHYRVSVRIERSGTLLWSGKLWAWGIHHHHHHHH